MLGTKPPPKVRSQKYVENMSRSLDERLFAQFAKSDNIYSRVLGGMPMSAMKLGPAANTKEYDHCHRTPHDIFCLNHYRCDIDHVLEYFIPQIFLNPC